MEVNAEMFDEALHEIPVFIRKLESMVKMAKKIENELVDFRQHLLKSVEDKEGSNV